MADFNYTGGVRFAPDKVVDVTADKDGNPTKACNPITGVCLEGGGSSDFSTAKVTATGQGMAYTPTIQAFGGEELSTPVITPGLNNVILYKGAAFMTIPSGFKLVSFSGAIEDKGSNNYRITGDCAIELAVNAD